jgi:pilus assembly protein FimV
MAQAQQQAQQAAKPEAKKAEPAKPEPAKPEAKKPEPAPAAKSEPAKPEPAKPAEAPKAEAPTPAVAPASQPAAEKPAEAPTPVAAPASQPAAEPKKAEEKKAEPKKVAAPPAPKKAKEPELMDEVLDALTDPLYLGGGLGVLVLGAAGFWLARRRRSAGAGRDEPVAPRLNEAAAAAAEAAAETPTPTAAPKPAAAPAAAAPAADEVDPLAEAEVYIAYGRDGQAEEILKEALSKNPKREEVQVKLLEIYAARKDKAAFGKIAEELNAQTGGSGNNWLRAAALGYTLDPGNAMYAAGKDAVGMAAPGGAAAADVDLDLGLGDSGTSTDIPLEAGGAAGADGGILDLGAPEKPEEPAAATDFALDIPAAAAPAAPAAAAEANLMDFQIELPKAADEPTSKVAPAAAAAAPADDGGLDFKLDDLNLTMDAKPAAAAAGGGGEKDGHWYDVQTKFDLAKAYQEMGDKDGAKEILHEVIKEGDDEQKAQAKTLLDSLG